jgi:hypothetical protein
MATFDLSNGSKPNQDPYILWQQLATRVRNNQQYNGIVTVSVTPAGLQVQFEGSTKLYNYKDKKAIARLLSKVDAEWWLNLPF